MNTRLRVAAYGVIAGDQGILLCRLSPEIDEFSGMWTLPGGRLEHGETPEECLSREIEEETGLTVEESRVLGVDSIVLEKDGIETQSVRIVYEVIEATGHLRNELGGTTDLCAWHPVEQLPGLPRVGLVDAGMSMAGISID